MNKKIALMITSFLMIPSAGNAQTFMRLDNEEDKTPQFKIDSIYDQRGLTDDEKDAVEHGDFSKLTDEQKKDLEGKLGHRLGDTGANNSMLFGVPEDPQDSKRDLLGNTPEKTNNETNGKSQQPSPEITREEDEKIGKQEMLRRKND